MIKSNSKNSAHVFTRAISVLLSLILMIGALQLPVSAASPKISSAEITIGVGEARTISLKNAEGTVKWSTSDKSVATVAKGKVTGVKKGTAVITATYKSKAYKCRVTVKEYRLYGKSSKMNVGESQLLKLYGNTAGKTVKWSTSDKKILKVTSKGKVTAVAAGTATVYASVGSKKIGKKITVSPVFGDTGKTLTIYSWNNEFQGIFEKYYPGYKKIDDTCGYIGDIRVEFKISVTVDDGYEKKLERSLRNNRGESVVDIFLVEEDMADKFLSAYALPLKDIGISDEDTKNMYRFTKEAATYNNELMAATWLVSPGGFVYRRSIAKKVLGTDDPSKVQNYLSSWSKFESVAAKMKKKGYYMVSNTDTMSKPFFYNEADRFVDGNEIALSDNMRDWLAISKRFYDKGFCSGSDTWTSAWSEEQSADSKVFGFFYSTWGVDYVLPGNASTMDYRTGEYKKDGSYGDWAFIEGPESYIWGGSYLAVGKNSDNRQLAADIIRKLCCNYEIMTKMGNDSTSSIYPNNKKVMEKMAAKGVKNDFLGGQNVTEIYADIAAKCRVKGGINAYDAYMYYTLSYYSLFKEYFMGNADYKLTMEMYYYVMKKHFSELYIPDKLPSEPK